MRGHQPLIEMRMKRQRPTFASIDVVDLDGPSWLHDNWHRHGLQAYLLVEPSDSVARLDLRCLVGLTVHLSGHENDTERVLRVRDACVAAGAERVITTTHRITAGEHQTVDLFDTQEL